MWGTSTAIETFLFRTPEHSLNYVFGVTVDDWQDLLKFFSANYVLNYSEDGISRPLPQFATIRGISKGKAITLEVLLPGFTINTHFFSDDLIQLNLLPEEVDSREKADAVFALMKNVSRLMRKSVYLVPEHGSAMPEELKHMAVCSCHPAGNEIVYHDD